MKKFLLLCLLALLPLSAALAEYDGWLLTAPDTGKSFAWKVNPLDARNAVVFANPLDLDQTAAHWTWYRDGRLIRDLPFFARGNLAHLGGAQFALREDGGVTVVVSRPVEQAAGGTRSYRFIAYDWTESGLQNPVEICAGAAQGLVVGSCLLACTQEGYRELTLYRLNGETLWQCAPPVSAAFRADGIYRLGDQAFLIFGREADGAVSLLCVDRGAVRWQRPWDAAHYPGALADGLGGFYQVDDPNRGDYSPLTLYHYDENGLLTGQKQLTGDRVVKRIDTAAWDAETGACTFYGSAVANSRRVYTVFALTVDAAMNPLSLDVRALSAAYRDYGPKIYTAPDGAAWVFTSDMTGAHGYQFPALVPFDALPAADGVTLALE